VLVLRGIGRGTSRDAIRWLRMRKCGACVVQRCEPTRQLVECLLQLVARRVVLVGGVPLVGPQEELRGPSGYTPRSFTSSPSGRRSKDFRVL